MSEPQTRCAPSPALGESWAGGVAAQISNCPPLSLPRKRGRAIACGNFGFEWCVPERSWIPKLRARADLDSNIALFRQKQSTCDCPGKRGRGRRGTAHRTLQLSRVDGAKT